MSGIGDAVARACAARAWQNLRAEIARDTGESHFFPRERTVSHAASIAGERMRTLCAHVVVAYLADDRPGDPREYAVAYFAALDRVSERIRQSADRRATVSPAPLRATVRSGVRNGRSAGARHGVDPIAATIPGADWRVSEAFRRLEREARDLLASERAEAAHAARRAPSARRTVVYTATATGAVTVETRAKKRKRGGRRHRRRK